MTLPFDGVTILGGREAELVSSSVRPRIFKGDGLHLVSPHLGEGEGILVLGMFVNGIPVSWDGIPGTIVNSTKRSEPMPLSRGAIVKLWVRNPHPQTITVFAAIMGEETEER
jgi:hypothetical protein